MTDDDYYPSAREALFGNGHVANLYCAVKWGLWHLFHALFVVFGVVFVASIVPMLLAWRGLKWTAGRLARASGGQSNPVVVRTQTAVRAAREMPVTRRIYNECPVDIKTDPRWFERLSLVGKRILAWAENETVWYCDECENWYRHEPLPHGWCDGEPLEVRKAEVIDD